MSVKERPDGSGQITASYWFFGISLCFAFVSLISWGSADGLAVSLLTAAASSGLCSLSFVLLSIGWIIRAISFLPGQVVEKIDETPEPEEEPLNPIIRTIIIAITVVVFVTFIGSFAWTVLRH